jgi:hypothetical protein
MVLSTGSCFLFVDKNLASHQKVTHAKEDFRPRSIKTGLGPGSSVHATPVSRKLCVSINASIIIL